jgi:hypothetical protein
MINLKAQMRDTAAALAIPRNRWAVDPMAMI